ncbi:unnamed protein product [Zymoseptoria tritici ST99CH_3D1]|uniref:Uncharacterized protein n=1 Tax=Zymoseptoria tritici (strain ST99CH_3D7) TaxID=1276538 RepID=A0A1X7RRB6_ZYMT9|nr:unnamed protein product [Zymoseptoria tritici ST99CH_3D7]SMR51880.1 unnamed protein product [Zymoseptoria tritici ST99CH_3D1]
MIPPPIVQSVYAPARSTIAESAVLEKTSPFDDRQEQLQADLQFLLDAQADGLIRGLEGGGADERSSAGSTTPTMHSAKSASGTSRRPPRRQPGLRSARKGIYRSILALAALKDEELRDVDRSIQGSEKTLAQINAWEQKREGLREASHHVDDSEETIRVQRLRTEADAVQAEINKVELQLMEMKTRHRKLIRQAAAIENSVQAKMASYTSSLQMLEEDIQKFLSFKPVDSTSPSRSRDGSQSVWQLPPKRRNLEMAKEYWTEQHKVVELQRKQTEFEKSALVEGAAMWEETVSEITAFEKRLRSEMSTLTPDSPSAWEDPPSTTAPERLKDILEQIDTVTELLQDKLKTADERGWKLLVVAIGAELDALIKGKEILVEVLEASGGGHHSEKESQEHLGNANAAARSAGETMRELDMSLATARAHSGNVSDADDDHPDPELLFSKHEDTDAEE